MTKTPPRSPGSWLFEGVLGGALLVLVGCGAVRSQGLAPASSAPAALSAPAVSGPPDDTPCDERGRTRAACEAGEAGACTRLGREALTGMGLEDGPDPAAARAFFQRACDGGDGEGCARHALSTLLGEGVARDEDAGRAALRAACERTPRAACGLAAAGLAEDARRQKTPGEAEWVALFAQEGCHAGDGFACRLLGDVFLEGRGLSADSGKAFSLYARACEAGDGEACADQGALLRLWEPGEAARADGLLSRGCELGSPAACGRLVLQALHSSADAGEERGRRALFTWACDQGAAVGCLALYDALRHEPGQVGSSLQLPALLKRACQLGEERACGFLEDVSRVAGPACAAGSASSCGVMGALLLSAPHREREAREGRWLLRRACEAGDGASCTLMDDTQPRGDGWSCRSE